jgi:flagellar assembly protein FliH
LQEAEETKSLSKSNLLKVGNLNIDATERVINVNERIAKRLEELSVMVDEGNFEGFSPGLIVKDVTDTYEGEDESNVIQAQAELAMAQLEEERREAQKEIEEAREQAQMILRDARSQAQAERQKVLEEAKAQGLEAGRQRAAKELDQAKSALEADRRAIEDAYEKQVAEFEPRFVESITGIYEAIFRVDLSSYREILLHLLENAMRKAESSHEFLVRVSAQDYPYVSMHKKELAVCAAGGSGVVMITEDASLKKNQCLIETDGGIFDCGLETQLTELGHKLRLLSYDHNL